MLVCLQDYFDGAAGSLVVIGCGGGFEDLGREFLVEVFELGGQVVGAFEE